MAASTTHAFRAADWGATVASLEARHAHFREADAGATRARILQVSDGRCRFSVCDPGQAVQFRGAHARAGRIAIKFLSWTGSARYETSVLRGSDHHLALHIPLSGSFTAEHDGRSLRVHPGQMLVVSAPGLVRRHWEGACDLLNVMIARAPGRAEADRIDTIANLPTTLLNLRQERTLTLFIENLVQDLGREQPAFCEPAAAAQAEGMLLTLLERSLRGVRGLAAPARPSTIAPYYIRRAEAFMARHYAQPLRMADLARACGISLRTLHHGFAIHRDHTAGESLRGIRLDAARGRLATQDATVASVAAGVGYRNASQFSRDYKAAFGESPSVTRRCAAR